MKSLDLFSGIGGFALGFHWAGIETSAFCEIEDYPTRVLNKNFPGVPVHRDIRKLDGKEYKGIDIITGGFPCQPHSLAGKRLASEDSRDLWGEMYRIICEAQPKWVVAENVPGLLSSENGRYFGRVLRDLAEEGYCVQWFCISASAVGAWHKRDRIWLIATYANNFRKQVSLERQLSSLKMFGGDGENCKIISKAWETEPGMGRVVNGLPRRVDRIKGLGNAVVPQIPYLIGQAIKEVEQC